MEDFKIWYLACGLPSSLGLVDDAQHEESGLGFGHCKETEPKFWAHSSGGVAITGTGHQTDRRTACLLRLICLRDVTIRLLG